MVAFSTWHSCGNTTAMIPSIAKLRTLPNVTMSDRGRMWRKRRDSLAIAWHWRFVFILCGMFSKQANRR